MTDEPQPTNGGYMSAADVTGVLSLIDVRLGRMEDRILARLDLNSAGAAERWAKHDADLATNTKRISDRFMKIESALDADIALLNAHLAAEHDAALVMQARMKPVRMAWLRREALAHRRAVGRDDHDAAGRHRRPVARFRDRAVNTDKSSTHGHPAAQSPPRIRAYTRTA